MASVSFWESDGRCTQRLIFFFVNVTYAHNLTRSPWEQKSILCLNKRTRIALLWFSSHSTLLHRCLCPTWARFLHLEEQTVTRGQAHYGVIGHWGFADLKCDINLPPTCSAVGWKLICLGWEFYTWQHVLTTVNAVMRVYKMYQTD